MLERCEESCSFVFVLIVCRHYSYAYFGRHRVSPHLIVCLTCPRPQDSQDSQQEEEAAPGAPDFDYLLGMNMWMLTKEKKDELLKKRDEKLQELKVLKAKTPSDLWTEDLDAFIEAVSGGDAG